MGKKITIKSMSPKGLLKWFSLIQALLFESAGSLIIIIVRKGKRTSAEEKEEKKIGLTNAIFCAQPH